MTALVDEKVSRLKSFTIERLQNWEGRVHISNKKLKIFKDKNERLNERTKPASSIHVILAQAQGLPNVQRHLELLIGEELPTGSHDDGEEKAISTTVATQYSAL